MGNTQANQKEIFQENTPNLNDMLKDDPINTLLVNSYTWSKDSHGLYDYEGGNNIKKQHIKVTQKSLVQKKNDQMHLSTYDDYKKELQEGYKSVQAPVLGINQTKNNEYFLKNFPHIPQNPFSLLKYQKQETDEPLNDNSMWLIVRSLKQVKGNKYGCLLKEDDYIKLGRVKFRIKEVSSSQNKQSFKNEITKLEKTNLNNSVLETNRNPVPPVPAEKPNQRSIKKTETQGTVTAEEMQSSEQSIKDENKNCRICYGDTFKKDNPLLTPCKCSGSVQHVHIKCLQQWLQNKITTKSSSYCTAYMWKKLECELCGHKYPHTFKHNGIDYQAFEMKKPNSPYIIMEFLNKDNNECKGVHIITMNNKNSIKIGRGSDSDMKVTDISVSRCHGFINYQNGNFYLQDHNSKFGTLALIKNGINISPEINKLAIQVNRTVFYFYMKTQNNMSLCCTGKSQKPQNFILNPHHRQEKQKQLIQENTEIIDKIKEIEKKKLFEQAHPQKPKRKINLKDNYNLPIEEEKKQEDKQIKLNQSQQLNPNDIQHSNILNNNSNLVQQQQDREQKIKENYQKFNQLFPQSKSEIKQKNRLKKSQINQNYIYNDMDLPGQQQNASNENQNQNNEILEKLQQQQSLDLANKYQNFHNNEKIIQINKKKITKNNCNNLNIFSQNSNKEKLNKSDLKEIDDNNQDLPEIQMQKYNSEQQNNKDLIFMKEQNLKNSQKNLESQFIGNQVKKSSLLDKNQPQYPNGQFNEIQDLQRDNNLNNQLYILDDEEEDKDKNLSGNNQEQAEFTPEQNYTQREQLGRHIQIKKMSSNFNPKEDMIQFQD